MAFSKYAKIVSLGGTIAGGGSYIAYLHREQNRSAVELAQARSVIARVQTDMDSLRLENALLSEKYCDANKKLEEYKNDDGYNNGLALIGIGGISLMCVAAMNSFSRLG